MKKVILILSIWVLNVPAVFATSLIDLPPQMVADTGKVTNEAEAAYDHREQDQDIDELPGKERVSGKAKTFSQKKKRWKKRPISKQKSKGSFRAISEGASIFLILIGISLTIGWLNPLWLMIIAGLMALFFIVLTLLALSNGKFLRFLKWIFFSYIFFQLFRLGVDLFLNGGSPLLAGVILILVGIFWLFLMESK